MEILPYGIIALENVSRCGYLGFGRGSLSMDETSSTAVRYAQSAEHNRATFDTTLEDYVGQKLAYPTKQLEQGERELWFDATDCVWCVFDDPAFERYEDAWTDLRASSDDGSASCDDEASDLQIYWSLGDVVMPAACDSTWVASRIADEAARQFRSQGYRCKLQERTVDGEPHVGVSVRVSSALSRMIRRVAKRS